METCVPVQKFSSHARSVSLPSASHTLITSVGEHLQRLKSSADASSSSSSSSSHALTCQKLDGLKNLYDYLDDVLHLAQSQRILSNNNSCEAALRILDICGEVREIYSQMKENVQQLESSLRRKRSGEFSNEVATYTNSKKHMNKVISKCYKELKRAEKDCTLAVLENDSSCEEFKFLKLIQEIQQLSLSILESTLSFVSHSKTGSNTKAWSFIVSKLIQQKGASKSSDIEKIEVQLHLLNGKNSESCAQTLSVVKQLEAFNSSIQESEELLESVFRQLLKTRVSLLNILNH